MKIFKKSLMSDVFSRNMTKVLRQEEDYCENCLEEPSDCYICGGGFLPDDNIECNTKGHKHKVCR